MNAANEPVTVDDILKGHSPEVRRVAEALRLLIHQTLDGVTEKAYPGWHGIGFRHPSAGYICGIFPLENSARLLFEKGRLLSDPRGLLQGQGKQTRYIEIQVPDQIHEAPIRLLLLEAASL